jgi:FkbM family methyltransferase
MSAVLKSEDQPIILKAGEKQDVGYAIPLWLRDIQIKHALSRIKGRIEPVDEPRTDPVALVCFGPSLMDTWEQIRNFRYVITCSGAHKFLTERGIIPTYHMEVDPRAHKVHLIGQPNKETEYWISSTCHKAVFDHLEGYDVRLWHVFDGNGDSGRFIPPGEDALVGGCGVGLRLFQAAAYKGFRDAHVFGMDGCERDGMKHAAAHPNEPKKHALVEYPEGSGTFYKTTASMLEAARATIHEVTQLPKMKFTFYGEGLVQAMMKHEAEAVAKPAVTNIVSLKKPDLITPEFRELNAKLHHDNALYGAGGHRHAELVKKLVADTKAESVLDYGCGKGTLAEHLPFPIWQYDPAIPGKDEMPRSADLVLCLDVLEHIEPELLNNVLAHLSKLVKKVGYFVISTRLAKKTYANGRNAHLIVKPAPWWEQKLNKFFSIGTISEQNSELHVVVGPKGAKSASLQNTTVKHDGTDAVFYTPNDTTKWRANTLFTKEPCTIAWIDSFKKGEVFYDIGANVGGYSIWAAKRRGVKVYAFEPEASNYAVLCKNMTLNDVDGAAYCLALKEHRQDMFSTIYLSTQESGGSCNTFGEAVGPDLKARKGIPQGAFGITLDTVAANLPQPDHIKIDVDGLEHRVISGGPRTIANAKSLLVEVNTNLPEHLEMVEKITDMGFTYDQLQVDAATRKDGAFKGCAEYVFTNGKKNAGRPWKTELPVSLEKTEGDDDSITFDLGGHYIPLPPLPDEHRIETIDVDDANSAIYSFRPRDQGEVMSCTHSIYKFLGGLPDETEALVDEDAVSVSPLFSSFEAYVEAYVISKIDSAPIISYPFPHLYIEDIFPADFKLKLPRSGYKTLEKARGTKGYPNRYVHKAPEELRWMVDGTLRKILDRKFGVESSSDEICLLRDKPGYSIPPHTDSPGKVVTALFYMTENWTTDEHGTTLYTPLKDGFTDREGIHHPVGVFNAVWTAPGKPNSMLIFARTDNSFYGCKRYNGTSQRDILLYDSKR